MLPTRRASCTRTSGLGLFRNAQPPGFRSDESSLPSGMGCGEGTVPNIYSAHSPVFTPMYGLFVFLTDFPPSSVLLLTSLVLLL